MATDNRYRGILRTDYEAAQARLKGFVPMTTDEAQLLHRLAKEERLLPLWENHVLTVLADIHRKKLSGYGESFADAQGTAEATLCAKKLKRDINGWHRRLEAYIDLSWKLGCTGSVAVETARKLANLLKGALPNGNVAKKKDYYRMLRTVTAIQDNIGIYLQQAEDSGDIDPALSLLIVYLKNYGSIAEAFNRRLATLPELYRKDILHAAPQEAVQDNVYVIITPTEGIGGFTLPKDEPFPAGQNATGEELIYWTEKKEYISPMQCVEADALYGFSNPSCGGALELYKQTIKLQNTTDAQTLFAHGEELRIGWQLESPMLVLNEGERNISIYFHLTADSSIPNNTKGFVLQLSGAEGWMEQTSECYIESGRLCFCFSLPYDAVAPASCMEEVHGTITEYPAIRILTDNANCPYKWAQQLIFDSVEIKTEVNGIRNFSFYNDQGEVDTTQPLHPFGIQAECGACFLFGNEEMSLKNLQEVRLKGIWKKLSETEEGFNKMYKEYGTDADAFKVSTEYQKGGRWKKCGDEQKLFSFNENGDLNPAEIVFSFTVQPQSISSDETAAPYEYSRDKDGFFRITLESPSIGFGTKAYRTLFSETMVHNSGCKEKKRKDLPSEPVIPVMADVELSYIATEETTLSDMERSFIRLSRITALSRQESFPIAKGEKQPFLPSVPAENLLYFGLLHALGEQNLRLYLDMVLPQEKNPFYDLQLGRQVTLAWEYWSGNEWHPIAIESVLAEETLGLTQSGFIEIKLPEKISGNHMDKQGRAWIRAAVTGDLSSCLAVRGIRTNCIRLISQNGDGTSLPAGTIQGIKEPDERIESVTQPLSGFGGKPAETATEVAVRQSSRISNRHRALMIKDYEHLVLEFFPEVDKIQCIPIPQNKGASKICLVVFSRAEDSRYFLSPAWKLAEIQQLVRQYTSPFASLRVMNPVYERVNVHCKAILWDSVPDKGKAVRQLVVLAQNYIAPWYRKEEIPMLRQRYSYKELHARMVNHEDLMRLVTLEVNGKSLPSIDVDTVDFTFEGKHPWSVLLPIIKIELLSLHDGIEKAEIGSNFIIG
ncbi:hypothetical protein [Bacteroides sp.]|uniref:hypothetical protein n=1 Tax=Bacteroides sp. TaxID=29523 RepID=UPI003A8CBCB0